MKSILSFIILAYLVSACTRPMLQPPVTLTPRARLVSHTAPAPVNTATAPAKNYTQSSTALQNSTASPPPPTGSAVLIPTTTPVWCPVEPYTPAVSGKLRVAFASQGDLWLWEEGNTTVQLTESGHIDQVTISNDGQVIVFTYVIDDEHAELWAINADGSNQRRVVSADELNRMDGSTDAVGVLPVFLQWEPGTHHLTFSVYPIYHALWVFNPELYWVADLDTGMVSPAPYGGGYIGYSPDGSLVVIYSMVGINLAQVNGSNLRADLLEPYLGVAFGEQYYVPRPYWASDSSSLRVALPNQQDMYNAEATSTIWHLPVVGIPEILGQSKGFNPSINFSPDMAYMTYWSPTKEAANWRELHIVHINGHTSTTFTDIVYLRGIMIDNLIWSPDSQHFIFQMADREQQSQFYYLGNVCQQPTRLGPLVGGETHAWNSSGLASWIDFSRYLLQAGTPGSYEHWELHLGQIGQTQTEVLGEITAYDWAILP